MPDREERHLLSEDLGSGEPVSRASAQKKNDNADVLILAAQNLNNFRFQTNILSAMRVVCVKCSKTIFKLLVLNLNLNKSLIRKQKMVFKQG